MLTNSLAPDEFDNLVRQMNQMVDRELRRNERGLSSTDAFRPAVNLYETQSAYVVCVDVAGMNERAIEVSLEKNTLIICGRRLAPMPPDGSRALAVHLMEISHGTFRRTVEVPESANPDQITANYREGLLWITIPKLPTSES